MDRVIEKKRSLKIYKILPYVGFVLLGLIFWYGLLADTRRKLNIEREKLNIQKVKQAPFQEFIIVDAEVQPLKTYYLDIVEAGVVEKIMVEDGQTLRNGDTILKLSNTTLQVDYLNRESQLMDLMNERQTSQINMQQNEIETLNLIAEIEFQLKRSNMRHERNQKLIQTNMVSEEAYQETKLMYEFQQKRLELAKRSLQQNIFLREQRLNQLDASISRMKRNLKLSEHTLSNLYITAPSTGRLSTLNAEIGEAKQVGENIGQIDNSSGFKIRAKIDEHYISQVREGMSGSISFGDKHYKLRLQKLYPEVKKGEFLADLIFVEKMPYHLKRGQNLQVKISLSGAKTAMLIPRGAFYQATGGQWIFVVNERGNIAEKRSIKIGRQNPWYYEVTEGLEIGEKVITSQYDHLAEFDVLKLR